MTKLEALALNCGHICAFYDARPGWKVLIEYEQKALDIISSSFELPKVIEHKTIEHHFNEHMSLVPDFCAEAFEILRGYSDGQIKMNYPETVCKEALNKLIVEARSKYNL